MVSPSSAPILGIEPFRFLRWAVFASIATNLVIVFTGGVVRVSGSGLGCPDWPTCSGMAIAPVPGGDHAGWQAAVEFGNRLLSFPVLLAALAVLYAVYRTRPRTQHLVGLAWALPLGVLAQAAVGGVTVLTGLSPVTVAAHFLLSMYLVAVAMILHERVRGLGNDTEVAPANAEVTPGDEVAAGNAGATPAAAEVTPGGAVDAAAAPTVSRGVQHATTVIVVVAAAVLFLGTAVTGAGPHGGDVGAARLPLDIRLAAIAHADAVWLLVGVTAATVAVTWHRGPVRLRRAVRLLLAIQIVQGAVGYLQYATGIPPVLVSLHIIGAAVMWAVAWAVWARARPIRASAAV